MKVYKEKKDYAKVSDCYKNLIGIAGDKFQ